MEEIEPVRPRNKKPIHGIRHEGEVYIKLDDALDTLYEAAHARGVLYSTRMGLYGAADAIAILFDKEPKGPPSS